MKQIIVMVAMISLGIAIFKLIAGGDENSIIAFMKGVWEEEIMLRTSFP